MNEQGAGARQPGMGGMGMAATGTGGMNMAGMGMGAGHCPPPTPAAPAAPRAAPGTEPRSTDSGRSAEVRRYVGELIAGIQAGRLAEVYKRFYTAATQHVEPWMREYPNRPTGPEHLRNLGEKLDIREPNALRVLVDANLAVIEWRFVVAARHGSRKGEPFPLRQVWLQTWDGDKVVVEEYFAS